MQVTAGGEASGFVSDPRATNLGNAPDLYFFDITGLSAGDEVVISAANSNTTGSVFNTASIAGLTFDTFVDATVTAVPEPSSLAYVGLGGLGLLFRRRK